MSLPLLIILAAFAGIFGWQAVRGITKGVTCFPMRLIGIEEFERGHTLFWGVVGANVVASVGSLVAFVLVLLKGW